MFAHIICSIWPIDETLSGATTPSNANEEVLHILRSSLDCLMLYPGHSLVGGSYPSVEMKSMYYTAPADCATRHSLIIGSYPSVEMQSMYYTVDWATRHSLVGGSYPSVEMQSMYYTAPADCTTRHSLIIGSYPSVEMQSMYYKASANSANSFCIGILEIIQLCSNYMYLHMLKRFQVFHTNSLFTYS